MLSNSRFYILLASFLFSLCIYFSFSAIDISETQMLIKIQQIFGLTSMVFLYVALLIGPFCYALSNFPWNTQLKHARRAIGVSAFYFALLHVLIAFFKQLGGIEGLVFLDNKYLLAVGLGFAALIILFFLTITSLDWAIKKMQFKNWKLLHRFVYLASIAVFVHALMLGSHFGDLSGIVSQLSFFAVAFLLLLEAPRFEKIFSKNPQPKFGWATLSMMVVLFIAYTMLFSPLSIVSLDIHATHKQLAREANQNNSSTTNPALKGDKTLRYTVSFLKPDYIKEKADVSLGFKIYNATTGSRTNLFQIFYEKPMHMIAVDDSLSFFNHLHPTQKEDAFSITTQFPHPGTYRTYVQFQPFNAIEQQVGFAFDVGNTATKQVSIQSVDTNLTKQFGNYEVTLDTPNLNAKKMSLGEQTISLTLKDAKTKKPITNLKPYLGSFGHMTMIKQDTYDFIHIHPADLTPPKPNETGGPTVSFLPIGLYGQFKPGMYRMFVEFNPDGKLFTADFTVKVQ